MRIVSFGGGIQSTAMLVLAAQGKIKFDRFMFANVGDDSENPGTIKYMEEVSIPYAKKHGIEIEILQSANKEGVKRTIYDEVTNKGRDIIPVRLGNGAPGNRTCTNDFKIRVLHKRLRELGASKKTPFTQLIGISIDEIRRVRDTSGVLYAKLEYPLVDLHYSRLMCVMLIEKEGLPIPPKSSCWFCPFKKLEEWREMAREEPGLFEKAIELETNMIERFKIRDAKNGRTEPAGFLTRAMVPLEKAIGDPNAKQLDLFCNESCSSGYCAT